MTQYRGRIITGNPRDVDRLAHRRGWVENDRSVAVGCERDGWSSYEGTGFGPHEKRVGLPVVLVNYGAPQPVCQYPQHKDGVVQRVGTGSER